MDNVVVSIFAVESEAFQAFTELRQMPLGEGYTVIEAGLLKSEDGIATMEDFFGARAADAGETKGIVIGALVGILGGPIGVLLGATYGGLVGTTVDTAATTDSLTAIEVIASKLCDGEVAIVALVQEEEPAFDAAFAKYQTINIRYDVADIADEVDRMYDLQADIANQVVQELKADRKAERAERRAERKAAIADQLDAAVMARADQLPEI